MNTTISSRIRVTPLILAAAALMTICGVAGLKAQENSKADRVSLFQVPLQCGAAPEIGCGSRAKPILLELEGVPTIAEAWLNETGTVLAVVGSEDSTRESRAAAVRTIMEQRKTSAAELEGELRARELKSFGAQNGWYRGAGVDALSNQEAGIIAARLVRRIEAKTKLSAGQIAALKTGFAGVFSRSFTVKSGEKREDERNAELSKIAKAHLDEPALDAFREAIAQGYRPQPGEK